MEQREAMEKSEKDIRTVFFLVSVLPSLCFALAGLCTGAVEDFFRLPLDAESGCISVVHQASQPFAFWAYEGCWFFEACVFLLFGLAGIGPRSPIRQLGERATQTWRRKAQARRVVVRPARAKEIEAQVRSVEAGQGPEPPWMRFPDPADAFSEARMTTYFLDDFARFWFPLAPEARAAYLRRNPPPGPEWQVLMTGLLEAEALKFPPKWQMWLLMRFVKNALG